MTRGSMSMYSICILGNKKKNEIIDHLLWLKQFLFLWFSVLVG